MAGVVVTAQAPAAAARAGGGVADNGLRRRAIGCVASVVTGVASTAPRHSLACHRRETRRPAGGLLFAVVAAAVGGVILTWVLVRSVIDLSDPASSGPGEAWFGLGPPLVIAIGFMALGALLMAFRSHQQRTYFERRAEVLDGGE